METLKIFLKDLLDKSPSSSKIFKRNILKEYLQIIVLDFIYSHKKYGELYFYGGSCLSHCYGLPRLSEDLDFVDMKKDIEISELAKDLEAYFKNKTDIDVKAVVQKFRIYLKFPLLKDLGLSGDRESEMLFVKVEVFKDFNSCRSFKTEVSPLFKMNKSILVKTFDLPTLMATKIMAVLTRKWEKTDKKGKILAKVKGRDYFDLMWYLGKGVIPNIKCVEGVDDMEDLKKKLIKAVEKVDSRSIRFDLEPLISDEVLVKKLGKNMKDILIRGILKL